MATQTLVGIIGTEPFLGVRPADELLLYIILSPVGAYYPEGFAPVSILVEENYVRAAPGGVGETKTSANYAAGLKAQVVGDRVQGDRHTSLDDDLGDEILLLLRHCRRRQPEHEQRDEDYERRGAPIVCPDSIRTTPE